MKILIFIKFSIIIEIILWKFLVFEYLFQGIKYLKKVQ